MSDYIDIRSDQPAQLRSWNGNGPLVNFESTSNGASIDVRAGIELLRRRSWLIAALGVVGFALGYLLVRMDVPYYQATATVRLVDPRSALGGAPLLDGSGTVVANADPLLSQLVVLKGRGFVGELVDREGLRLVPDTAVDGVLRGGLEEVRIYLEPDATERLQIEFGRDGITARTGGETSYARYGSAVGVGRVSFIVDKRLADRGAASFTVIPRERAINRAMPMLVVDVRMRTDAIDISFTSTDPVLATRTANAAAELFQTANARSMRQMAVRRRVFLEEQLRKTDSLLVEAQAALSLFRQREQVYSSSVKMEEQQGSLTRLEIQRQELNSDRMVYESLLVALGQASGLSEEDGWQGGSELRALFTSPQVAANPIVSQLVQQLQGLASERDTLTTGAVALTGLHPRVQTVDSMVMHTERQLLGAIRGHLRSMEIRLAALDELRDRRVAELRKLPEAEAQQVRLIQEVEAAKSVGDQLRADYQAARIAEAVEAGRVEIVSLASGAAALARNSVLKVAMGLFLGLLVGLGAVFGLEYLNTSIRRPADVESVLQLPGLAIIPNLSVLRNRRLSYQESKAGSVESGPGAGAIRSEFDGDAAAEGRNGRSGNGRRVVPVDSPGAEAFRTLRTNLLFSTAMQNRKLLVITSAVPGEGKTTTAVNLAIAFAHQGMHVLLVDGDLRRPKVHDLMQTPRYPGLGELLQEQSNVLAAYIYSTEIAGLHVLPAGRATASPAELLSGLRLKAGLEGLSRLYDKVVIDAAPILATSEAAALAARADGVLVVIRAGTTERALAREALRRLDMVGAEVLGAVINDPKEIVAHNTVHAYRYAVQEE